MSAPFLLGVNYWPRRKAMYWWNHFDRGEVAEEFALIRDLGLKIVRIFLLWDDFQPQPQTVNPTQLANLEVVSDLAADLDLQLDITFFTGHMSGPNWAPRWLLDGPLPPAASGREVVSAGSVTRRGYRNMFHDPQALEAERLLLRMVVGRLKDHPAIWAWNLGNEPDLFAQPQRDRDGQAWVREMRQLIRKIDARHPVTCGLHGDSLLMNNGLRVDQIFTEVDIAVMHAYPMYTPWARGPLDPDFLPFMCALTAVLSGKAVLMEEFGGPTNTPRKPSGILQWTETNGRPREQFMASEEDMAAFLKQVLPRLHTSGAKGAFLWCFADYVPELWEVPPCNNAHHERSFGLVRTDGSLKPHAHIVQAFADTDPRVRPRPEYARLQVDPERYYADPANQIQRHYQDYLDRLASVTKE